MRILILAAALLGACASTPDLPAPPGMLLPVSAGADQAGNRIEPLGGDMDERCTFDGAWCVEAGVFRRADGQSLEAPAPDDRAEPAPWGFVVRLAEPGGPVLLGQVWRTSDAYSGGGASQAVLVLYRFADGAALAVLTLQQAGDALIRACFSEADTRARRGACHDDYRFSSHISLDPANAAGWPVLRYETQAASFPGAVSRSEDAAERGALTAADLVWRIDEGCTITRSFAWNGDAGAYMPSEPLPDCADYRTQ